MIECTLNSVLNRTRGQHAPKYTVDLKVSSLPHYETLYVRNNRKDFDNKFIFKVTLKRLQN